MSRNPYFAHLPTRQNRQDLVFALDSLPHLLSICTSSTSTSSSSYPSPPGSPCSPYTTFNGSFRPSPWSTMSSFSSISSTSSVPSNASISSFYQQQYQQRLVQRHIRRPHSNNGKSVLQFSTRAQAMGFLINLLQSFQQEPCECDLVQGCFCSPEGVEDHSGLAPCYVCGEWYAEEVFCRMDDSEEYTKVDGRSWHERGGASLRHQVAETRVRQWLNQVVVPIASAATFSSSTASFYHQQQQPQHQGQSHPNYKDQEEKSKVQRDQTQPTPAPTNVIRSRPGRSASCPATFSIPEEILDPSTRSPGFRIKRRDTISTECPVSLPSSPLVDQKPVLPTTSFSAPSSATSTLNHISGSTPFRFSFTSMRFNAAVQESLSRRSSITTISPPVDAVDTASAQELTPANNSNNSINNDHGNACANTTTESQTEALAEQTEAELGTEAETVTVARSETKSASAQTYHQFTSSILCSSSRGSSTSAGRIYRLDQSGVTNGSAAASASTATHQTLSTPDRILPFASCSLSSLSSLDSMDKESTPSHIGKTELESARNSIMPTTSDPPQGQQQKQQQLHQEGQTRGRVRRRGHGHIRQLAQSHIQIDFHVMGSSFPHCGESEIGRRQVDPLLSSSSSSLPCVTSSARSSWLQLHGQEKDPFISGSTSPPESTAPPPSSRKKTVSFSLPLPSIVITPSSPCLSPRSTTGSKTVKEWPSSCNTPSSLLPPDAHHNNNSILIDSENQNKTQSNRNRNKDHKNNDVNSRHAFSLLSFWLWSASEALSLLSTKSTTTTRRFIDTIFKSAIAVGSQSFASLSSVLFALFLPTVTVSSPCT